MGIRGLQTAAAAAASPASSGQCSSTHWGNRGGDPSPDAWAVRAAGPLSGSGAVLLPCDLTMDQLRHVSVDAAGCCLLVVALDLSLISGGSCCLVSCLGVVLAVAIKGYHPDLVGGMRPGWCMKLA
jgi:hypothetical protein